MVSFIRSAEAPRFQESSDMPLATRSTTAISLQTLERAKIRPPLEHAEYRETQEQNADSLPYNYTEAITSRLTLVRGVQRRSEILEPPVIV
jgi:hypothetical protein